MLDAMEMTSHQDLACRRAEYGAASMRAKSIYYGLLNERGTDPGQVDEMARAASRVFLTRQLEAARNLSSDLPEDVRSWPAWSAGNTQEVGRQYREYLSARKAGGERQYFGSKSHALYFLRAVAPTKMVDGAWLYGLVQRWNEERFSSLIRIYLEELGEGLPGKNHVVLYRKLLASHDCDRWDDLDDDHFTQGAIQLSLAHHADDFLPEVIGFNLGYEQLPLHLLISAYELNELNIDPYYFTLHITVDNVATGHARKSLQAVTDALPRLADRNSFYQRVINGYKLNMLGAGTHSAIESFDLVTELLSVLKAKATVGAQLHSDYCRVAGRTVTDWLSEPGQLPAFLEGLEKAGWIKRNQDPENSRFWKLIEGERAEMFGVFNAYERQLIYDWIGGSSTAGAGAERSAECKVPAQRSFRAERRLLNRYGQHVAGARDEFSAELKYLEERLAGCSNAEDTMALLSGLMSPANHHTAAGLTATRIFTRLFS